MHVDIKRRKINKEYLRHLTSPEIKPGPIDVLEFARTIKEFADDTLRGIMSVTIEGTGQGTVNLNLHVTSYLIRMFCDAPDDDFVEVFFRFGDELVMEARFKTLDDLDRTGYIVNVAKYAGFSVTREGNTLFFSAKSRIYPTMKIYATNRDFFLELLKTTYYM